jgi:hypothetical protein
MSVMNPMSKFILCAVLVLSASLPSHLPAAETAVKASAADVSGTWDVVVETPQGSGTPVFVLKQDGEKLTGTYKGQLGEAPVTGTISGNAITLKFTVNADEQVKVEYRGTVDGNAMKGTARFGTYGDGTFSGTKRAR